MTFELHGEDHEDSHMVPSKMNTPTQSAAQEGELREAAKRLEKTRVHSEYWAKAADDLGLDGHMRMYVHCAINSWKNAAYAMSDKVVELEGQPAAPQPPITKDAPAPAQDGCKLVPIEPTKEMKRAFHRRERTAGGNGVVQVWAAMLAASPPPQPTPPAQPVIGLCVEKYEDEWHRKATKYFVVVDHAGFDTEAEALAFLESYRAAQPSFQQRIGPWMLECFGEVIAADTQERNHRFLEESLELVQACGATASEAHQLVDYVYGRPVGEKAQEAGGAMVTLAALCRAQSIDMHECGEIELARISEPSLVEKIRAKQAAKPKHSPLPAQPNGVPAGEADRRDAERYRWLRAQHWSDSNVCVVSNPRETVRLGTQCPSNELLDEFIDAAIARQKETGNG